MQAECDCAVKCRSGVLLSRNTGAERFLFPGLWKM